MERLTKEENKKREELAEAIRNRVLASGMEGARVVADILVENAAGGWEDWMQADTDLTAHTVNQIQTKRPMGLRTVESSERGK